MSRQRTDHIPGCACVDCFETLPPSAQDTAKGLFVILGIGLVLLAAFVAVKAFGQTPNPPVLVRIDGATEARTPSGDFVFLPAGSEISSCGATPWRHDIATRALHIPRPRVARPCDLFCDGLEQREVCP
jgi:hypothetical protein